jgi:outer membrane protein insertion porin family
MSFARTKIAALMCVLAAGGGLQAQTVEDGPVPEAYEPDAGIDPRPLADVSARLGYNTDRGVVAGVSVRTDRFLGNQSLRFDIEAGDDMRRLGLMWSAPDLLGKQPAFGVRFDASLTDPGDVFGFASETYRLTPSLTWQLGDTRAATVYGLMSHADISKVAATTSQLIRDDAGDRTLLAIGAGLRDRTVTGSGGSSWSVDLEGGATDTDHRYLKLTGRYDVRQAVLEDAVVLSARLRAGTLASLDGTSNIGDRFMLGSESLRGFGYGGFGPRDMAVADRPALGGNTYAIARFDARMPGLVPADSRLVPGLFVDVGSLWSLDSVAGGLTGTARVDDQARLRASAGVSLEIGTGLGPISINLGFPVAHESYDKTQEFSLSFQSRF